ncbi:MAG: type I DNA topoisomerase [Flavobacteriales bacterium]|nr:type I DNA topoisomerase [Flavobacteriales bacterium]
MSSNLVIVESPAKAKTIENYLGNDYIVKSSFGQIRDLPSKGINIEIENNFKPLYKVSQDKQKIVTELKSLAKKADIVWLATDEDREGEAISWHLKEALSLNDEKTRRITFNEITKKAILKAVDNPREINKDLVDAQQARRILDRIVGFELSPVLWRKVKPQLSAGRVQSVTVRLIVEREDAISSFQSLSSFKITAKFESKGKVFKAAIATAFKSEKEAQDFLNECIGVEFKVKDVQQKPGKKTPSAPFTTSTLQQEASRKLGFNVSKTMSVAQRLYESGRITYMRTDSVNFSDFAINAAADEIKSQYGEQFCNSRRYATKNKSAQEAHEAIRPTDFSVHSIGSFSPEDKLYQLIWKRAISSQMSDAQIERTRVTIGDVNLSENFVAVGEVIKFEGFLKVYLEGNDDDQEQEDVGVLPNMESGDSLLVDSIKAHQRFTRPPARFTEAALVKKLEELGIGRPSTYAPTIKTIQDRGYVERKSIEGNEREFIILSIVNGEVSKQTLTERFGADKGKLFPTTIGEVVNGFLVKHFEKIMNYNFTANVEKELDMVANGDLIWTNMLGTFYQPFHTNIEHTLENAERATGERELGVDPVSGEKVIARLGKFGPMIQIGVTSDDETKKPKFASLSPGQNISSISLEDALELFNYPKNLGDYLNLPIVLAQGKFGPYLKYNSVNISIPKGEELESIGITRAIDLIELKKKADAPIAEYEGHAVTKGKGRFGPFIKWNSLFININKKYDYDTLSQNDIVELIEDKKQKEKDKVIHNWEKEGISVLKGKWGRFNVIKGKQKIELPKTTDAPALTLEDVKAMFDSKSKKKSKK